MKLKMIFPKGVPLVGRWERNTRAHDTKELYARERYNPVFEYYYLVPRAARVDKFDKIPRTPAKFDTAGEIPLA